MARADASKSKICQSTLDSQTINRLGCNHALCMENMEKHEADNKYSGHCNDRVEGDESISSRVAAEEKVESIEEETECPICLEVLQSPILRPSGCNHYFCYGCLENCAEQQFACPIDRRRLSKVVIYDEMGGEAIGVEDWKPDCTLCYSCLRKVLPGDLQFCDRCNQPLHLTCDDHVSHQRSELIQIPKYYRSLVIKIE
nr:zinc finger protein [Hymenolepis microstoma]